MSTQKCPLCERIASFESHGLRRRLFHCEHCIDFIISNNAEGRLIGSQKQGKDQLSAMARVAPEGKVLVITLPAPSQQSDVATKAFCTNYEQRA